MKNKITDLLFQYNSELLIKLQSNNALEEFINKCNQESSIKFEKFLADLDEDFIINDEAEYNYFESIKNQIIIDFFNSNSILN